MASSRWVHGAVSLLLGLSLLGLNLLVWRWANPPLPATSVSGPIQGLAYTGFQRWQSPLQNEGPTAAQVQQDLQTLSGLTRRLRTYSATEMPGVLDSARALGFRLTAGVWLDRQDARNAAELAAIREMARRDQAGDSPQGRVLERIIAGNETLLHGVLDVPTLLGVIHDLQRDTRLPVSTAEPWHIWLSHPELVEAVDYIAVHLLPYWEGVPSEVAVHEVWRRYEELRRRYPDKPLVIAEVGWPSQGAAIEKRIPGALNRATASPAQQARFLREFVATAQRRSEAVDYYLMEAIDQPWKALTEGAAGPHWGILDAHRQPKFEWRGAVEQDPHWRGKALLSGVLGLLILWPFLLRLPHLRLPARLAFGISAQAVSSLVVVLLTLPLFDYLRLLDILLLALLVPALALMAAILLSHAFEFSELFWDGNLRHRVKPRAWSAAGPPPRVCIHLACCNEPPDMVLAAVRSLQALNWPDLEIWVVDNNTRDEALWRPLASYVAQQRQQGDLRLNFLHLDPWPGFKAGALNEALRRTSSQAQWIGVIDADYIVQPHWLSQVAGHFQDPDVAVVQSPQAHRDWDRDRLSRMMNWEYEGFFRLGMHHRHERNAIIQHGTMTLIRAQALRDVGGWDEDCVCEDTELGLRLLRQGWRKVYVDEVLGTGLVPHDFAAYQRQRERWARGGMQILRRHAAALLRSSSLTRGQRYHFLAGWLPWWGDTLHGVFTLAALAWSVFWMLDPAAFALPTAFFAVPLGVFFLARLAVVPLLYWRRVGCSLRDVVGASWAGMALSHRIARGVLAGLFGGSAVFHITRKRAQGGPEYPAEVSLRVPRLWPDWTAESVLLALLMATLVATAVRTEDISASVVAWWVILVLQSLPYVAAVTCQRWVRGASG